MKAATSTTAANLVALRAGAGVLLASCSVELHVCLASLVVVAGVLLTDASVDLSVTAAVLIPLIAEETLPVQAFFSGTSAVGGFAKALTGVVIEAGGAATCTSPACLPPFSGAIFCVTFLF